MNVQDLRIVKSDERGIMVDCDKLRFIARRQGSISANHTHDDAEILYLVKGAIELTVGEEIQTVRAPAKIEIPGNIYHKLIALTDIELLEDRKFT
jgi:mannose-6-phosphate isomerase-like protein (cupin superfamily)